MSGFSRNKGRREEQQLVLYLAKQSFRGTERILRQYQESGQPDVKGEYGGTTYTFEMKSRKESFKKIYELYYKERDGDTVLRFVLSSSGTPVAMSTDIHKVLDSHNSASFRNLTLFPPPAPQLKVFEKIVSLKEWKQAADFLVIKDNNKNRIFIRYW